MKAETFKSLYRIARLENLGALSFQSERLYGWFLTEVYDLRYPHVGDNRYLANAQ